MNIALKYILAYAIISVVMGIIAGLLVVTFDFTPHRDSLQIILTVVIMIGLIVMYLAYKKGRLTLRNI